MMLSASLVKDINPTLADANPQYFVASNGELYFDATDGIHGTQLWKTNGTAAGTMPATSLVPGAPNAVMTDMADINGWLYFFATNPSVNYTSALWKSDGTVAGTTMVAANVSGTDLTNVNGRIYFADGYQLWTTNGTSAGTYAVASFSNTLTDLTAAGNTLYFINGTQLWKSDGTASGTVEVVDTASWTSNTQIDFLVGVNNDIYVEDIGQLWVSDGTAAGTHAVQPTSGASADDVVAGIAYDGKLYFGAGAGYDDEALWETDGTDAGTLEIKSIPAGRGEPPTDFAVVNGTLFFAGSDYAHGMELWRSDGTTAGTSLVMDIYPGPNSSMSLPQAPEWWQPTPPDNGGNFAVMNGQYFFAATDGVHGLEVWRSDGTAAGTMQVTQINTQPNGSLPQYGSDSVTIGNETYFTANDAADGTELWKTDGTTAGTSLVTDLAPGEASSNIGGLFSFNGKMYFDAYNGSENGLWESDGTAAGTFLLAPNVGATNFTAVNNTLYFSGVFAPNIFTTVLYKTDGTVAGTTAIESYTNPPPNNGGAIDLADLNGTLYFTPPNDSSVWKTDGTPQGTSVVQTFPDRDGVGNLVTLDGMLYFLVDDGANGSSIWKTDGSTNGASVVWAMGTGAPGAGINSLYSIGNKIYFDTYLGAGTTSQYNLYASDGTAPGTSLLLASQYSKGNLTPVGDEVYFSTSSSSGSNVFYVTDGTAAGTKMVPSAVNGQLGAPQSDYYYFIGSGGSNGNELLETNGTTTSLADPSEASIGYTPQSIMTVTTNGLLFWASDAVHGTELWNLPFSPPTTTAAFVNSDSTTSGNWSGTYGSDGYSVIGGDTTLPTYVTMQVSGNQFYQWAPSGAADGRAPQVALNSPAHEAATDYAANSFSLDLDFTDGQSHQVALYLLDYDSQHRYETVQIANAETDQILSVQSASSFQRGTYLVYDLSGHLTITFSNDFSLNAVLSGIFFGPATTTTAAFAGVDTTTQGHWTGTYGSQGYYVIDGSSNLPSTVNYSANGEQFYQWAASTTDPRDLQTSPNSGSLIAACAYSNNTSFTINLDFLDSQTHQVSFYLLDYDSQHRAEKIQISNAITGAVLDTESFSNFTSGQYARWDLSGNVNITFTNAGGLNEVLSGFFIDPVPHSTSATFVTTDAGTEGNWTGVYGKDGYDVINSAQSLPSYATLSIPGSVSNYTWNPNATMVSALQASPGSSDRIAACDYSNNAAFSFNLDLTDGKTHQVALYLLDWDSRKRAETIQITDATTGKVLDSEGVSNFTFGKYLVWNLSGDVNITITNSGGLNEVLSGVFFG
jgi:ELWxxDGT repeat protein